MGFSRFVEVKTFVFCGQPNRPDELDRVEAAGGRVINWDGYRVLGVLATSRSIGNYKSIHYITYMLVFYGVSI